MTTNQLMCHAWSIKLIITIYFFSYNNNELKFNNISPATHRYNNGRQTRDRPHPTEPHSNVNKFGGYNPDEYTISDTPLTVTTDESLIPSRPPCLTQRSIGMYLQPLTRELVEVPPRPTIAELPDAVIDHMVERDKAFWVDKPGSNAYTLTDAYYNYWMATEMIFPPHQSVFPRSYQYDLDCVKYRRLHACDGLTRTSGKKTPVRAQCRDCKTLSVPGLTPFQLAWAKDPGQRRWRYYPDLTTNLSLEEIHEMMEEFGRPFKNEACNWYYKNYPSEKYDVIIRKFSR